MATMGRCKTTTAPMKVAQISKPSGDFETVQREVAVPSPVRCESRFRPAVSATVTCLRKKGCGLGFSIRVFPGTKLRFFNARVTIPALLFH